jgi:hypothetical protein
MGWLAVAWLAAGWFPDGSGALALAEAPPMKEYAVKAAFLYHFIEFVEWPEAVFPESDGTITIGVLGDDPFGAVLDKAVMDETVRGRKVVVRRFRDVGDVASCHVLFISKSETGKLPVILKHLEDTPVLTVSEVDGFTDRGGVMNFYIEKNKVRFEINQGSASRKGLKISSKLLCLGRIVGQKSSKEDR